MILKIYFSPSFDHETSENKENSKLIILLRM